MKSTEDVGRVTFNTGTMLDIATGKFVKRGDNHMLLGGLFLTSAVIGRKQTFKSSVSMSYFSRLMVNYPNAKGFVYDTEFSIPDIDRVTTMGIPEHLRDSVADRSVLFDKSECSMDGLFSMIVGIMNDKVKHKKDYMQPTPFRDNHGEVITTMYPTFILIDSWTAMQMDEELDKIIKDGLTKGSNTIYMEDGNAKTKMMRQLPMICKRANIVLLTTAHVGDKIEMSAYTPSNKDLPMMNMNDKTKGVGSLFNFLVSTVIQTKKVELLVDSNKKCFHPDGNSQDMELSTVSSVVCRCKNNISGSIIPHVMSQPDGLQDKLDYYQLLRKGKVVPFTGNGSVEMPMLPGTKFTRQNIRSKFRDNARFSRAMEVVGQYYYASKCIRHDIFHRLPFPKFLEKFIEHKGLTDEIVESRGVWMFESDDVSKEKKYMSVVDIAERLIVGK